MPATCWVEIVDSGDVGPLDAWCCELQGDAPALSTPGGGDIVLTTWHLPLMSKHFAWFACCANIKHSINN